LNLTIFHFTTALKDGAGFGKRPDKKKESFKKKRLPYDSLLNLNQLNLINHKPAGIAGSMIIFNILMFF
jgi:hypothetical protein